MAMGNFTNDAQEMLTEAGYEPCFVRDIAEGDTIAIDHMIKRGVPTEMVVTSLHKSPAGEGNVLHQWIGALPGGRKVHCSYGSSYPVWRRTQPDLGDEGPVEMFQVVQFPSADETGQ